MSATEDTQVSDAPDLDLGDEEIIGARPSLKSTRSSWGSRISGLFGKSSSSGFQDAAVADGAPSSPLGPKYVSKRQVKYRVMSLASTTPEKLFFTKIEAGEYGYALKLAQLYNLPSDIIWQRRFCLEPVNHHTIKDFLTKVKDHRWVLRECKQRVAHTEASQRALLEHGLKIAVPSCFDSDPTSSDHEEDGHEVGFDHKISTAESHLAYLTNEVLSLEDIETLLFRLFYLKLMDRLSTFSAVCRSSGHSYDPLSWLSFRSANLVTAALDYASEEKISALDVLFTYHSRQTLPYRLHALSYLPATCHPDDFLSILPVFDSPVAKVEADWDCRQWRSQKSPDWVETPAVLQNLLNSMIKRLGVEIPPTLSIDKLDDVGPVAILFGLLTGDDPVHPSSRRSLHLQDPTDTKSPLSPDLYALPMEAVAPLPTGRLSFLNFIVPEPAFPLSLESICNWTVYRARWIERHSGDIDAALRLIELGGLCGNAASLIEIKVDLAALKILVYECGKTEMGLEEFESLSVLQRFSCLLEPTPVPNSTEGSRIGEVMKSRAASILEDDKKLWREQKKYTSSEGSVLAAWLVNQSNNHRFDLCLPILLASHPDAPKQDRIIDDNEALVAITLEVCYACPDASAQLWRDMSLAYEQIPSIGEDEEASERMVELQEQCDLFDAHLSVLELLSKYDSAKPIGFFRSDWSGASSSSTEAVNNLFARVSQRGVRAKPSWDPARWAELLNDLLEIRLSAFSSLISPETVHGLFCQALLRAGEWALARQYLEKAVHPEQLIIAVSNEYFDSCNNPLDAAMRSALNCLQVVNPPLPPPPTPGAAGQKAAVAKVPPTPAPSVLSVTPEIRKELDLIEGVRRLHRLGLNVLPLQLRTAKNRILLLKPMFSKEENLTLSRIEEIAAAAELVGVRSNEDKNEIRQMAAEASESQGNLASTSSICQALIDNSCTKHWALCRRVAQAEGFGLALVDRMRLAAFSALHCPKRDTEIHLSLWRTLEARSRCENLGLDGTIPDGVIPDDEDELRSYHQKTLHSCMRVLIDLDSTDLVQKGVSQAEGSQLELPDDMPRLQHDFYGRSRTGSIYTKFDLGEARSENMIDSCKSSIFKLAHLTQSATSGRSAAVQHLAIMGLKHSDAPLFLAATFALGSPDKCTAFFDQVISRHAEAPKEAEKLTRLSAYFFAVTALIEVLQKSKHAEELVKLLDQRPSPQLLGVNLLISLCTDKLVPFFEEKKIESAAWQLFLQFRLRISDFGRIKELQALQVNVDVTRFGMDDSYKRGVILGLAQSCSAASLQQAIDLAKKYRSPDLPTVLVEHLVFFFSHTEDSSYDPKAVLKADEFALLSRPDLLAAKLESVYSRIPGGNFRKLTYWFELKRDSALSTRSARFSQKGEAEKEAVHCELHLKLLQKLSKIRPAPSLSYQRLTASSESAAQEIQEIVNDKNVHTLSKLTAELSAVLSAADADTKASITPSSVFLALVLSLSTGVSEDQVSDRSKIIDDSLSRLSPVDLDRFVKECIVGTEQAAQRSILVRLKLAEAVSRVLAADGGSRSAAAADRESSPTWKTIASVKHHLTFVLGLWTWLKGNTALDEAGQFDRHYYFGLLDLAQENGIEFNSCFKQMLANGIDPNVVGYFVARARHEEASRWKPEKKSLLELQSLYKAVVEELAVQLQIDNAEDEAEYNEQEDALRDKLQQRTAKFPPANSLGASLMLEALLHALERFAKAAFDEAPDTADKLKNFVIDRVRAACVERTTVKKESRILALRILLRRKSLYFSLKPSRGALYRADSQTLESLTSSNIITRLMASSTSEERSSESEAGSPALESKTPQQKVALFEKLLTAAQTDEIKLAQLGDLLGVWTRHFVANSSEKPSGSSRLLHVSEEDTPELHMFSGCWKRWLTKLADAALWDALWTAYLGFPEIPLQTDRVRFLSESDEEAVFHHIMSRSKMHGIKFGLKSASYVVFDLAIAQVELLLPRQKQHVHLSVVSLLAALQQSDKLVFRQDFDSWFVLLILRKGLLHLVPQHSLVFDFAINIMLWCWEPSRHRARFDRVCSASKITTTQIEAELSHILRESVQDGDSCLSFESTVASLAFRSHFALAGHIAMIHRNVPAHLRTVENALVILPRYLANAVNELAAKPRGSRPDGSLPDSRALESSYGESIFASLPVAVAWEQCRLNCREALQAFSEAMGFET